MSDFQSCLILLNYFYDLLYFFQIGCVPRRMAEDGEMVLNV